MKDFDFRVDNRRLDRLALNRVNLRLIKSSDMGYKIGDVIKFYRTSSDYKEWHNRIDTLPLQTGTIEAIYPYFFLVRVGRYRVGVNKVDVWLREGERVWNR